MPKVPHQPDPEPIAADALTARIDQFLASRGLAPAPPLAPEAQYAPSAPAVELRGAEPETFVCEDDVRLAVKEGRKLLIGERTIVTPAARDAGDAAKVFLHAGWPS